MRSDHRRQTFRRQRRSEKAGADDRCVDVTVSRIGAGGDGIAEYGGKRLYVPLTVPSDRVRVRFGHTRGDGQAGDLVEILAAGPDRIEPPCPHFGRCGGCSLQHLTAESYSAWKVDRLSDALRRAGLAGFQCAPLVAVPPGARRRVTFAAAANGHRVGDAVVGFHPRRGHGVVPVPDCMVVAPRILALVPALRTLVADALAPNEQAHVTATLLEGELDVVVDWPRPLTLDTREALAAFAAAADLARLSWRREAGEAAEPLVQRRPVAATFAGIPVPLPPGGFVQATREGEEALVAELLAIVGTAGRTMTGSVRQAAGKVADLFSGAGTFTFPLAKAGLRVHAIDADADLLRAVTAARGAGAITTEQRNLFTRPLTASELNSFNAVVLDAPRAGARAQAEHLAQSSVPTVVIVSCNPATFARDAHILAEGGYRLERVIPIDQFLWSSHLELIARFRR